MAIKILHIVGDSKFGGGSIIILRLAEAAKEAGFEVSVLTTDSVFQDILQRKGIGIVPLECIWRNIRPIKDLHGLQKLYRFLNQNDYHIIHTHTSKAGFVGRAAAWWAKVPIIVHTVHGFAFHEASHFLALKAYSILERWAAHWCHRLVTVSEYHRTWALKLGIGDTIKTIAIPNGISIERSTANQPHKNIRNEIGISSEEKILLTIGRLAPQKGLEYLLQSIPALNLLDVPSFKILLVGDGTLLDTLKKQAIELGISDKIIFLGFRSDIGNILKACDIVVLPSLREGLSIALLEAMAAEKPIITTTIGSNIEATKQGEVAMLVPPADHGALTEAIATQLLKPDQASAMAAAAHQRFVDFYTEEIMLNRYLSLYQELIKEKSL